MNKALWNVSLFLVLLGVICLVAGVALAAWLQDQKRMKGHVKARVVDFEMKPDQGTGRGQFQNACFPVIEYYANGFLYKKTLEKGAYPSPYQIGDGIEIDYDLNDPNRYRVRARSGQEKLAWGLSRGGMVLTAIGIFLFLRFAVRG